MNNLDMMIEPNNNYNKKIKYWRMLKLFFSIRFRSL